MEEEGADDCCCGVDFDDCDDLEVLLATGVGTSLLDCGGEGT